MSKTLLIKNRCIIACAGSGKTTSLVEEALKITDSTVLITTYTIENVDQINRCIIEQNGFIPRNIIVLSWFAFLLREGIRPYQNHISGNSRARSILFQAGGNAFHKKENYFTSMEDVYSNKASEFVVECNNISNGLVVRRLEKIYTHIFVDELQDLAGYDLNFLELLFASSTYITLVGDPRQSTYSTNHSRKNKRFQGKNIREWLIEQEKAGAISIEEKIECHRCNQYICDFADSLFPCLPKAVSKNFIVTGHDGIFRISSVDVVRYIETYNPVILRYDKRANTLSNHAINIGLTKGRTYDRVLIFPTTKMSNFLSKKDPDKAGDLSKFYVAVTRARYSVAFVTENNKS